MTEFVRLIVTDDKECAMRFARSLMLILVLLAGGLAGSPAAGAPQTSSRPNIVFILTDDLDIEYPAASWIDHFPRLRALLADQGSTFSNSFVSLSLCCPSRTTILRGQYAHNTEIFTNALPGGGFQKVFNLGEEQSTVATWLRDAGYRTVLLGKYLNGYPGNQGPAYIPPGWDEWYAVVGGLNYFNYRLNENGVVVAFGNGPEQYLTDVLADRATNFIARTAPTSQPFFMYLAPYAPHQPATPAPRHQDAFPDVAAPRPPSFDEGDVSDKPMWVQNLSLLTAADIGQLDALYRKRLQSMLAVEDLVVALVAALDASGQLDNTYIFFTSDNGFHLGQHRQRAGKNSEFEEDIRVPLLVRGPGVPAGAVFPHLVVNADFAPTFAELAATAAADFVDGRSLAPLLGDNPPPVTEWRRAVLLEHDLIGARAFRGIRTRRFKYIEYLNTGERELYDLRNDPFELYNAFGLADPAMVARLAARLEKLATCSGASCRAADGGPLSTSDRSLLLKGR